MTVHTLFLEYFDGVIILVLEKIIKVAVATLDPSYLIVLPKLPRSAQYIRISKTKTLTRTLPCTIFMSSPFTFNSTYFVR
ncbi:hypothetical protein HZ326_4709 [Fusarium oxysporum f. sp. albedinis]|nr:hypothetical protein HZ326_4709 [Fusarium oxysporum f. sp. albedinis]